MVATEVGPSREALAQVGEPIHWVQHTPKKRDVRGVCVGAKRTPSTIATDDGEFRGVQFAIQTEKGTVVWTCTFPDKGAPVEP